MIALTAFALLLHSAVLVCMAWWLGKLIDTTTEHEGNLGYLVEELGDLVEGLRHDRSDNAPPDTARQKVLKRPVKELGVAA